MDEGKKLPPTKLPPEGFVRLTASNGERNDVSIEVLENDVVPWKSIWQMLKKELGI